MSGASSLDEQLVNAVEDYTHRVRDDRPYEDTVDADGLRQRSRPSPTPPTEET